MVSLEIIQKIILSFHKPIIITNVINVKTPKHFYKTKLFKYAK